MTLFLSSPALLRACPECLLLCSFPLIRLLPTPVVIFHMAILSSLVPRLLHSHSPPRQMLATVFCIVVFSQHLPVLVVTSREKVGGPAPWRPRLQSRQEKSGSPLGIQGLHRRGESIAFQVLSAAFTNISLALCKQRGPMSMLGGMPHISSFSFF